METLPGHHYPVQTNSHCRDREEIPQSYLATFPMLYDDTATFAVIMRMIEAVSAPLISCLQIPPFPEGSRPYTQNTHTQAQEMCASFCRPRPCCVDILYPFALFLVFFKQTFLTIILKAIEVENMSHLNLRGTQALLHLKVLFIYL